MTLISMFTPRALLSIRICLEDFRYSTLSERIVVDLCENDWNGDLTPPQNEWDDDGDYVRYQLIRHSSIIQMVQ